MNHPFKPYQGMRVSESTVEERQEIYDLLNEKGLISYCCKQPDARRTLKDRVLYTVNGLEFHVATPIQYINDVLIHIPYNEFKEIISKL